MLALAGCGLRADRARSRSRLSRSRLSRSRLSRSRLSRSRLSRSRLSRSRLSRSRLSCLSRSRPSRILNDLAPSGVEDHSRSVGARGERRDQRSLLLAVPVVAGRGLSARTVLARWLCPSSRAVASPLTVLALAGCGLHADRVRFAGCGVLLFAAWSGEHESRPVLVGCGSLP
ncbi:pentapeptide repeat-containing protein [Actinoplanes sp. OR16]|uniref:pentapeptide repeat-containing protein n=1 Tax=Actinoplanes sp. OR16 TaxID=946334 RepID=UPI00351A8D1B